RFAVDGLRKVARGENGTDGHAWVLVDGSLVHDTAARPRGLRTRAPFRISGRWYGYSRVYVGHDAGGGTLLGSVREVVMPGLDDHVLSGHEVVHTDRTFADIDQSS